MSCPVLNEYPSFLPGGMGVCCFPIMDPVDLPPEEFFYSEPVVELRRLHDLGKPPKKCVDCMEIRRLTGFTQASPNRGKLNFRILSIARSSLCNRACRMCKPNLSTTLSGLEGQGSKAIVNKYLEPTILKYRHEIEEVYVAGGNPVQDDELIRMLALLDPNKVRLLHFTSNGTHFPDKILDVLKRFKSTTLCFSVDGDKQINELMRTFTNQEKMYDTIRSVLERTENLPNVCVAIQPTMTNVSIQRITEFYKELEANLPIEKLSYIANVCFFPEIYAPWNLTKERREYVWEKLADDVVFLLEKNTPFALAMIEGIIGLEKLLKMKSPNPELIAEFEAETKRFDKLTKTNLIDIVQL